MARKSVRRAVLEERAKHLQSVESPTLKWHRECVGRGMKGKKFRDRKEVRETLRKVSKDCAVKNPFRKKED